MNSSYVAIGLTVFMVLSIFIYSVLLRKNSRSQSYIVSQSMLLYRYNSTKKYARKLVVKTQSANHYDKTNVKVIILDSQAYWIKDNIFYKAPLVGQSIDKDLAEEVDTISMDKVQLDKMLFIMDRLREGINDDSRGSGDK
jgi:hypothetical protein